MTLTLPSIHINGTGRQMLSEGYLEAYRKLMDFREAFQAIEFNARDYYVQSSTAFTQARTERDAQHRRIGELMTYLEAHLLHLGE